MTQPTLTPAAFAAKWRGVTTTEKAAYVQLLAYKDDLGNRRRSSSATSSGSKSVPHDYDRQIMDTADLGLRNATYRQFVAFGRAPSAGEVAATTGTSEAMVREGWRRLHEDHALVLDPAGVIRMANPFAAQPTAFRVEAAGRSWFANCAWEAFGIGAALHVDSKIHTECADCHRALEIHVREGRPDDEELVFNVLVPAISWWNDIGFT